MCLAREVVVVPTMRWPLSVLIFKYLKTIVMHLTCLLRFLVQKKSIYNALSLLTHSLMYPKPQLLLNYNLS